VCCAARRLCDVNDTCVKNDRNDVKKSTKCVWGVQ